MPSRSSACAACCIVSQSDWLPMMMPTRQAASVMSLLLWRESERRRGKLRDDVRQQLAFDFRNLVLQHQLAFLQPLHLQLVEGAALDEPRDHVVEVAMLGLERGELSLEGFDVEIHRAGAFSAHSSGVAEPSCPNIAHRRYDFIGWRGCG